MIGSKAILLALLALFNLSLLSCQNSNTYYTDFSRLLTQKIPPSQSKRNLYPMLKTDLSDMILSDWHYTKEGSLLIKSNEDIERNSFIARSWIKVKKSIILEAMKERTQNTGVGLHQE